MVNKNLDKSFRILRRNYGSPGPDGLSIKEVKHNYNFHKNQILKLLLSKKYEFSLPRNKIIRDYRGKFRTIYIYNIYDRWVQQYIKLGIAPSAHSLIPSYVFGTFKKRSNVEAAKHMVNLSFPYILKLDISEFFLSVNQAILFDQLQKCGISEDNSALIRDSLSHLSAGLPQGNCLSSILADLYLLPFDRYFPSRYARFVDDLLFGLSSDKEIDSLIIKITDQLSRLGLHLNSSKTRIIEFPKIEDLL